MSELQSLKEEINLRFVEQEHRTLRVWQNIYRFVWGAEKTSPQLRNAAITALIGWFFSPTGVISITFPIGAMVGAYLAWNANTLLEKQNAQIANQNDLITAQTIEMRAARESQVFMAQLIPLIDFITDKNNSIVDGEGNVTDQAAGRVTTLSQTLGPYLETKVSGVSHKFSPERATLLTALLSIGFPLEAVKTSASLNFDDARFSTVSLARMKLKRIRMRGADLTTVDFKQADLRFCDFTGAFLPAAENMAGADLSNCHLDNAVAPDPNWINKVAIQTVEINPQLRPCADEIIVSKIERQKWRISASKPYRISEDDAANQLDALNAEMTKLLNSKDSEFVMTVEELKKNHRSWLSNVVLALNAQRLYPHDHSLENNANHARGRFLLAMAEWGIPFDPFIEAGAKFDGARLSDFGFRSNSRLRGSLAGGSFVNADLSKFSLRGSNLEGADLRGANLPAAKAFSGADLKNAKLSGAIVEPNWLNDIRALKTPPKNFSASDWIVHAETVSIRDCDEPSKIHVEEVGFRLIGRKS